MTDPPTPPASAFEHASNNVYVIYAVAGFFIISTLAQAVPKIQQILGPLGKLLGRKAEEARRVAIETEEELEKVRETQVRDLQMKITELEKRLDAKDRRDRDHREWDVLARIELAKVGIELEPPPPL